MKQTLSIIHNDKKIFFILIITVAFSSVMYLYLVNSAVMNVVKKEKLSQEIGAMQARLSSLESSYVVLRNSISLDFAYTQGFEDVLDAQFIERKPLGKGLSFNTLP